MSKLDVEHRVNETVVRLPSYNIPQDVEEFNLLVKSMLDNYPDCTLWINFEHYQMNKASIAYEFGFEMYTIITLQKNQKILKMVKRQKNSLSINPVTQHYVRVNCILIHQAENWGEPHVLLHRNVKKNLLYFPVAVPGVHEFIRDTAERYMKDECHLETNSVGITAFTENKYGANNLVCLFFGVVLKLWEIQEPLDVQMSGRDLIWCPLKSAYEFFEAKKMMQEILWLKNAEEKNVIENLSGLPDHWNGYIVNKKEEEKKEKENIDLLLEIE